MVKTATGQDYRGAGSVDIDGRAASGAVPGEYAVRDEVFTAVVENQRCADAGIGVVGESTAVQMDVLLAGRGCIEGENDVSRIFTLVPGESDAGRFYEREGKSE